MGSYGPRNCSGLQSNGGDALGSRTALVDPGGNGLSPPAALCHTVVIFQQQNIAENLQKNGGYIPGIRPGPPTRAFLNRVLTRITLVGALFLGMVAVLPWVVARLTGVQTLFLGSTSLLIVVGVAIDTMRLLEAQLLMRHYEGFIK